MSSSATPSDCRIFLERQQALQQEQQKRLARRIHDIVSQKLTVLSLQLSMAEAAANPPVNWAQTCRKWSSLTIELGQDLRDIISDLKPRIAEENGLVSALHWYANSSPETLLCRVIAPPEPICMPVAIANEFYAICRDVVGGLYVPQGATSIVIRLERAEEVLRVHIRPGPNGPCPTLTVESLESWSIGERMLFIGGKTQLNYTPEGISVVTLSLPAPPVKTPEPKVEETYTAIAEMI